MIPTLILFGLVFGRWWRLCLTAAALGWPVLLVVSDGDGRRGWSGWSVRTGGHQHRNRCAGSSGQPEGRRTTAPSTRVPPDRLTPGPTPDPSSLERPPTSSRNPGAATREDSSTRPGDHECHGTGNTGRLQTARLLDPSYSSRVLPDC